MTRDDIIKIALEAGLPEASIEMTPVAFERFAALVAVHAAAKEREWMQDINKRLIAEAVAAEREACAKVAEQWPYEDERMFSVAQAIRSRGEQ